MRYCISKPLLWYTFLNIFPINAFEHLQELMAHFHLPVGGLVDMSRLMELIDRMVTAVPMYRLRCRNDVSAAEAAIAYFGLKR